MFLHVTPSLFCSGELTYYQSVVVQSRPALCDPMDCSPPSSSVHGFPRQEYWSGLPFPSPGDLPDPGIESMSFAVAGGFFTAEPPGKAYYHSSR